MFIWYQNPDVRGRLEELEQKFGGPDATNELIMGHIGRGEGAPAVETNPYERIQQIEAADKDLQTKAEAATPGDLEDLGNFVRDRLEALLGAIDPNDPKMQELRISLFRTFHVANCQIAAAEQTCHGSKD